MDKNLNKTTLKVASGAAAALATTLGVSAHADTVDDVNVPSSNIQEQASQTEITAQDVESAKQAATQAKTEAVVAESQTGQDFNANQEAVQDVTIAKDNLAQAQQNAVDATPANITQAQTQVSNAEASVERAKSAVDETAKEVDSTKAQQAQAQADVQKAQAETQKAQADAQAAQNAVNTAKANAQGAVSVEQAQAEVTKAEQNVNGKTALVATAQADVEDASQAHQAQETKVNEAQTAVDTARAKHETATANVDKAQAELEKAKTAVASLSDQAIGATQIATTPEWITAMKELIAMKTGKTPYNAVAYQALVAKATAQDDAAIEANKAYLDDLYKDTIYNGYSTKTVNGETKVYTPSGQEWVNNDVANLDPNNLPADVLAELNQHIATLINSLRTKLGLEPIYVNTNEVEFAKQVASKYRADNHEDDTHYGKGINQVASSLGLKTSAPTTVDTEVQFYENQGNDSSLQNRSLYTKAELFAKVDNYMSTFFYEGYQNYGHALSLLTQDTFGAAYSQFGDMGGGYQNLKLHILGVKDHSYLVPNGRSEADLKAEYNKLYGVDSPATVKSVNKDNERFAAETALRAAEAGLITAKSVAVKTASDIDTAEATLTSARNDAERTTNVLVAKQQALVSAQANLDLARTDLATARQTLATVNADQTEKQALVASAEQELAQAQARLNTARNAENVANATLNGRKASSSDAEARLTLAKAQLRQAENDVLNAKAYVQDLVNARTNLEVAQSNYDKAVQAQAATQARYDQSKANLEVARTKATQAEQDFLRLSSAYDAQQATKPVEIPAQPKPEPAPAPVIPAEPKPEPQPAPAPVETVTPAPTETVKPAPAPVVPAKPATAPIKPVEVKPAPAPVETVTPAPTETVKPVKPETAPAKSETATPEVAPAPTKSFETVTVNPDRPAVQADVQNFTKPVSQVEPSQLPATGEKNNNLGLLGLALAGLGLGFGSKRKEDK
jgi:hypothetical protein